MPTIQLTLEQHKQAIASLTPDELQQFNRMLDIERRDRLAQLAAKARHQAASASPEQAEQIIREAVEEVRAKYAPHRRH